MRRLVAVLLGVALVSVLFVGCGGGDDDEASGDDVEAANAEEEEEESDDDGNDDSGGVGAAVGALSQADCVRAVQALGAASASLSLALGGESDELEKALEDMKEFADDAPDEIKDEIETLSEAYGEYAATIRESGWDPGTQPTDEQVAELEEASEKLEADDVKDAQAKLDEWFEDNCNG